MVTRPAESTLQIFVSASAMRAHEHARLYARTCICKLYIIMYLNYELLVHGSIFWLLKNHLRFSLIHADTAHLSF
jgi:hypothetical protein